MLKAYKQFLIRKWLRVRVPPRLIATFRRVAQLAERFMFPMLLRLVRDFFSSNQTSYPTFGAYKLIQRI